MVPDRQHRRIIETVIVIHDLKFGVAADIGCLYEFLHSLVFLSPGKESCVSILRDLSLDVFIQSCYSDEELSQDIQ
jgi:hypothetical protein